MSEKKAEYSYVQFCPFCGQQLIPIVVPITALAYCPPTKRFCKNCGRGFLVKEFSNMEMANEIANLF